MYTWAEAVPSITKLKFGQALQDFASSHRLSKFSCMNMCFLKTSTTEDAALASLCPFISHVSVQQGHRELSVLPQRAQQCVESLTCVIQTNFVVPAEWSRVECCSSRSSRFDGCVWKRIRRVTSPLIRGTVTIASRMDS